MAAVNWRDSVIFEWLSQEHSNNMICVKVHLQCHIICSSVNTATEDDLNMHSSKGFYTTILVNEESHSVTALWLVVVSVLCMVSVYPGMQQTSVQTTMGKITKTHPGFPEVFEAQHVDNKS